MNDNNINQANVNNVAVSCENKSLYSTSTGYAARSIAYAKVNSLFSPYCFGYHILAGN